MFCSIKRLIAATLLLSCLACYGAASTNKTPLLRSFLQSDMDGNQQSITNLAKVVATNFYGSGAGLSNLTASGGGAPLNANQFSSNTLISIKSGASVTNIIVVGGSSTNFNTNYFNNGTYTHRMPYWEPNGPTGYTWRDETGTSVLDFRKDGSPNNVIYWGDAEFWEGFSLQMKGGGATGTDPNYPSNRFTISFSDFWGWRFNQLDMNAGSEDSFGADPLKQITFIRNDNHRHFSFGPTNGLTTLQGTNIIFAVTNGAAGTNGAIVMAGLVSKNKGWTFYANMTNSGGEFFLDNNKGIWFSDLSGNRFKAIYEDNSGDDNLIINAGNGGIILQSPFVSQSSGEFAGFLQCDTLTASQLTGTASDKKLTSIVTGSGLSLSAGTLSATGDASLLTSGTIPVGRLGNAVLKAGDTMTGQLIAPNVKSLNALYVDTAKMTDLGNGKLVAETGFSGDGSSLTSLNASQLSSGTVPDARFPATLPAVSGVNLTALNASQLTSGTVPAARQPALTGDVTASAGSTATTLAAGNAGNLNSGTLLAARLPALTGDITSSAGSAATTLAAGSAANLNSGTLSAARLPALTGDITTSAGSAATTLKNTGTAGTYAQTTFDAQGRETSGSTTLPIASVSSPGFIETNKNVNAICLFTNNGVSIDVSASGIVTLTNYAAANLGMVWSTNSNITNSGNLGIGGNVFLSGQNSYSFGGAANAEPFLYSSSGAGPINVRGASFNFERSGGGGTPTNGMGLFYKSGASGAIVNVNTNLLITNFVSVLISSTAAISNGIIGHIAAAAAASGIVGEVISSLIASGSAVSLSTGTGANVTSISLTAGDWDVSGNVSFSAATATVTGTSGGVTTTSATVPTDGTEVYSGVQVTLLSETDGVTIAPKQINVSSTTTVYLAAKCNFSAGTVSAFGAIRARRVR